MLESCKAEIGLTLMLWVDNKLAHHRLNDTYVAVKCATEKTAKECHPEIHGEANNEEGGDGTETAHDKNRFAAYPIRKSSPVPAIALACERLKLFTLEVGRTCP